MKKGSLGKVNSYSNTLVYVPILLFFFSSSCLFPLNDIFVTTNHKAPTFCVLYHLKTPTEVHTHLMTDKAERETWKGKLVISELDFCKKELKVMRLVLNSFL